MEADARPAGRTLLHACARERLDLRAAADRVGLSDRPRHRAARDLRRHARRRERALRLCARGFEFVGLHRRAGASHACAHRLRLHASFRAHPRAARHGRARGLHLLPRVRHLLRLQGARTVDRVRTRIRSRRSARRSRSRRRSGSRASSFSSLSLPSICCAPWSRSRRAICAACANCSARAPSQEEMEFEKESLGLATRGDK